jgi:hypothetical protein
MPGWPFGDVADVARNARAARDKREAVRTRSDGSPRRKFRGAPENPQRRNVDELYRLTRGSFSAAPAQHGDTSRHGRRRGGGPGAS